MTHYKNDEQSTDQLLSELIKSGKLSIELDDQDIDTLLSVTSPIELSENFSERALAAIKEAQRNREVIRPTENIGNMIAVARTEKQFSLPNLADQVGLAPSELDNLESGNLSLPVLLNRVSPQTMYSLLQVLNISIGKFTEQLMEMAIVPTKNLNAAARTHRQSSNNSQIIERTAEYINCIELISKSNSQ